MCESGSKFHCTWKWLFLAAEAVALLGCLFGLTWSLSYRYYGKNGVFWASNEICVRLISFCEQWLRPMFWSFIAASLILLIISPFFMRSALRRAAFRAWVIGVLTFLCILLLVIFGR